MSGTQDLAYAGFTMRRRSLIHGEPVLKRAEAFADTSQNCDTLRWTFLTYVSGAGRADVQADLDRLSDYGSAHFQRAVAHLAVTPKADWKKPQALKLANVENIYEIRFKDGHVQTRALGFFGPGRLRRMTARPTARHAYVEAEVATALAHQIRVLRQQRGWTQRELAHRLGTTQAAISRLEDPAYGKPTLKTLMDLAKVFDTGLQVRFVSFVQMLNETWQPKHQDLHVEPFEQEAPQVHFHEVGRTAPPAVRVQVPVAPSVGPAVRLMPLPDAVTAPIIHLADTSSAVTVLDHAH